MRTIIVKNAIHDMLVSIIFGAPPTRRRLPANRELVPALLPTPLIMTVL